MKLFVISTLCTLTFFSTSVLALATANTPCNGEAGSYFVNLSGEIGGFVAETASVSDKVYLGKNTQICGQAEISQYAQITGNAIIKDHAKVYGRARVFGNALVYDHAEVYDSASIWANAKAYGHAKIFGIAGLKDNVRVYGQARMYDATYGGNAVYF